MNIHKLLASALLVWLVTPQVESDICERGWFGENCTLRCQCLGNLFCGRNGECQNGHCSSGYFGPACQYMDLVSTDGSPSNQQYYQDNNATTCNPAKNTTPIIVSLRRTSPFTWIRIVMKEDRYLLNFSLELNTNQECSNERRYTVDSQTVDITCDNYRALNKLTIKGAATRYICSIFISPGRNVALKQTAIHSTVTLGDINSPSNAVDGNIDNIYENKSCSYTSASSNPYWRVTFQRPKIVLKAVIYNRNTQMAKLDGFQLEAFDAEGNRTDYYVNAGASGLSIYDVVLTSMQPISWVKITAGSSFLYLCEVLLFGDAACPEGRYGFTCERTCYCAAAEVCSTMTGTCATGCPIGKYGTNCTRACPAQCYGNECSPREGVCFSCFPGFTGARCDKPCQPGSYGHQCSMNCSKHCTDVCNNQNGVCKCDNNNTGANCTDKQCPSGFFGSLCTNTCSQYCYEKECLLVTGECIACYGFREGRYCEDCPAKSFGELCQKPCSEYCVNATCDKDTGNCPSCTNGYSGFQCSTGPNDGLHNYWFLALPLPVMVSACFVMVFFFGRKKQRNTSLGNEDEAGS